MPFEPHVLGGYRAWAPPGDLAASVEAVWLFRRVGSGGAIPGPGHRVLPETGVSVCLRCLREDDGAVTDPALLLLGPARRIRFFRPERGLHMEGVRLKSEWCRPLLGLDPGAHIDGIDALGREGWAGRLREALTRTRSSEEAVLRILETVRALARGARREPGFPESHAALERIRRLRATTLGLGALSRDVGRSERHLRRSIRRGTGLSPKTFHRIRRLNRALEEADATPRPGWSALAIHAGFYDQAHLIREVRDLTGTTPTALHAERRVQARSP